MGDKTLAAPDMVDLKGGTDEYAPFYQTGPVAVAKRVQDGKLTPFLSVPYPSLSASISGLRMRELTIIVGNSYSGKTTFALDLACRTIELSWDGPKGSILKPDERIGWLALEDDVETFTTRLAGKVAGIPPHLLMYRTREDWDAEELVNLQAATGKWQNHYGKQLTYLCRDAFEGNEEVYSRLETWLDGLRSEGHPCRLLILDYLQLLALHFPGGGKSVWVAMGEAFDWLLSLAQRFGLHILALAIPRKPVAGFQQNRLSMVDILGPMAQIAGAHNIIALYRAFTPDSEGWAVLDVLKTRFGKATLRRIALRFEDDTLSFVDEGGLEPPDLKPEPIRARVGELETQVIQALVGWAEAGRHCEGDTLIFQANDLLSVVQVEGTQRGQETKIGNALRNLGYQTRPVRRGGPSLKCYVIPTKAMQQWRKRLDN